MDLDDIDWSGPEEDDMDAQLDLHGGDGPDPSEGVAGVRIANPAPPVARRVRQKTPGRNIQSAHMLKRCQTDRALEKT